LPAKQHGVVEMSPRKQPTVWFLIADGEHARIVVPRPVKGQFRMQRAFDSAAAHKRAADLGTDRPGRVFESATTARHAVVPRSDPHELEKLRFAEAVAKQINEEARGGAFDRLVLVAPAHALNAIREKLSPEAHAKVVGSVMKDLVRLSDADLSPHLTEWWRAPPEEI
jgi:protein required for attachment to host cells